MDDKTIIELYWSRNEQAIAETDTKYGSFLQRLALNILSLVQDAEECVNDTYIRLWETIPPTVPQSLGAYSAKITRNLSLDKCKEKGAQKRGENDAPPSYEELEACLPSKDGEPVDELILKECINTFLASLDKEKRVIFIQRYFYMCEIKEIAKKNFLTEANVKVTLSRLREKFKKHLERY